jgi:hypothetical protein
MVMDSVRSSLDSTSEEFVVRVTSNVGLERQNTLQRIVSSFPSPPVVNAPKAREFSFAFGEDLAPDSASTLGNSPLSPTYSPISPCSRSFKKPRLRRVKPMASEALREARRQGEWDELRKTMEEGVEAYCHGNFF